MKSRTVKVLICVVALSGAALMIFLNLEAITGPKAGPREAPAAAGAEGETSDDGRRVGRGDFTPKHAF